MDSLFALFQKYSMQCTCDSGVTTKVKEKYGLNVIKMASDYGKDVSSQRLINESKMLCIDPNKNRTNSWLEGTRLQLPFNLKN